MMQLEYLVQDWKTEVDPFVLCNNLLLINYIFSQKKEHVSCVNKKIIRNNNYLMLRNNNVMGSLGNHCVCGVFSASTADQLNKVA